jgi:hypothetical protein
MNLLPPRTAIVGYARSSVADAAHRAKLRGYLKQGSDAQRDAFLALCTYRAGGYDDAAAFGTAALECEPLETALGQHVVRCPRDSTPRARSVGYSVREQRRRQLERGRLAAGVEQAEAVGPLPRAERGRHGREQRV